VKKKWRSDVFQSWVNS